MVISLIFANVYTAVPTPSRARLRSCPHGLQPFVLWLRQEPCTTEKFVFFFLIIASLARSSFLRWSAKGANTLLHDVLRRPGLSYESLEGFKDEWLVSRLLRKISRKSWLCLSGSVAAKLIHGGQEAGRQPDTARRATHRSAAFPWVGGISPSGCSFHCCIKYGLYK